MEYRCRLGTAGGEILEETHVSDSEGHLRHELEQKGFCVLGIQPRGMLGRISLPGRHLVLMPWVSRLIFNQELATLLKAGMPLVQSLDILRSRVEHPTFRQVLDEVHDLVRAGSSLSDAFSAHGDLFPAAYGASLLAGEKSGSLDGVLRRYVAYMKVIGGVKRRGGPLIYPAVSSRSPWWSSASSLRSSLSSAAFYDISAPNSPGRRGIVARCHLRPQPDPAAGGGGHPDRRRGLELGAAGGPARWWTADPCGVPWPAPTIRRFATSQMARTLDPARRGSAACERHRHRVAIDEQPLPVGRDARSGAAVRKARRLRPCPGRGASSRTSSSRWPRSASRPAPCRR
jgi:hypothetical protein